MRVDYVATLRQRGSRRRMTKPSNNLPSSYLWFAVLGLVGMFGFALGEAVLRTRYDVGLGAADIMRSLTGAVLLSFGFVAVAWVLDTVLRLNRLVARVGLVVATALPLGAAIYLVATEPSLGFDDAAPAIGGVLASGYLLVRSEQFEELFVGVVGPMSAATAACAVLLPAQYGADRWVLNGLPVAMLACAMLPTLSAIGAFVAKDVSGRGRSVQLSVAAGFGAAFLVACASLPHIFPGVVFYLKLVAVALAASGTASVVAPLATAPRAQVGAATAAFLSLFAIATVGWSATQSVSDRFGALGFDSVAGIGAALVSAPEDRDGDGWYAGGVPVADCDDDDPRAHPGSPTKPCLRVELAISPAKDDTWHEQPKHVIVVLSDALRARDVYDPKLMPTVATSREGRVAFARAYSPGNTTRLSVRPMFTGVTPVRYVMQPDIKPRPDAWWFLNLPDEFAPRWIVASEFAWMHDPAQWTDDASVDSFIGDVDANGRNIDLAVDSALAHIDGLQPGQRGAIALFSTDPHAEYRCDDGTEGTERCYRDEIAALDRAMARLFEQLKQRGVLDSTLVVLTSDHGEELGEHGHFGQHASTLYEEQIHVPLVFWYPALPDRIVEQPVSTLGLVPTLADILGHELAFPRAEGSLLPAMLQRVSGTPSPVVHHWTGLVLGVGVRRSAVITSDFKLEYDWRTGHTRLADLVNDPAELSNVAGDHPQKVEELLEVLHRRVTVASKWSEFAFVERPAN